MNKEVLEENQLKAQQLIDQAYDLDDADKARALAQQALELDPKNVEAYSFMGHTSMTIEEVIDWYQKGNDLGKELLGADTITKHKGTLGELVEAQPYLSVKENLGMALYVAGQKKEAIKYFQELLELNTNDDQGARYSLAIWLVEAKDYKTFHELYEEYKEDDAVIWKYTYAIALFQEGKNIEKANQALLEAHETNPNVLPYLTGQEEIPEDAPEFLEVGDKGEAVDCVEDIIVLLTEEKSDTLLWIFSFYEWITKE